MEKLGVEVEYIFHSGFAVETENHFLVFDYFKGDLEIPYKATYVFVTHGHEDHFNPEILDFKGDIKYIFSDDFRDEVKEGTGKNITFMKPYKEKEIDGIQVKTFSSTDLGLSLLVNVDGIDIFFAGDLNWWEWKDDSNREKELMEHLFKKKISRVEGENVDIAFFPVDPRLEENYSLGGEYFIEQLKPKYLFPMHFGDNYSKNENFIHKTEDLGTKVVNIKHNNQVFKI